jgi:uncharacterized protein YndB with AHSA1/START domain
MSASKFFYVTFIRTTPEKLWQALVDPEFTRQYWCETQQESDWKKGSPWKIVSPTGKVADAGEIIEIAEKAGARLAESSHSGGHRRGLFADDVRTRTSRRFRQADADA